MATGKKKLDLSTELLLGMLAGSAWYNFLTEYTRSLPRYIDDAEKDFGLDIYERMLRDPGLASSIGNLKVSVMSQGPRFLSRVPAPSVAKPDPEKQALYDQAEEIRTFIQQMMDGLQQPLEDILKEMLDFLSFGHKLAEEVYELRNGRMVLSKLKTKPRTAYNFVVDRYMNLQGLVPGKAAAESLSTIAPSDIIPREKFFILSCNTKGGDPRGTSMLRPAYNPWYLKQQIWPMYLKFLAQFGTPSMWAELPADAGDVELVNSDGSPRTDDEGNVLATTAAEALLQKMISFANGTAMVVENGTKIELIEPKGDGKAFLDAIDCFDRQMTKAVLIVIRATMESQYGSKADSETAQDILGNIVQDIRRTVEVGFYRDVINPIVRLNFGDEAADGALCPYMSLSEVAQENIVEVGNMVANLARSEMIHASQYPGIDNMLGLPERDFEAQMLEIADARQQAEDRASEMRNLFNPTGEGAE